MRLNKGLGYYTVDGIEFDSKIKACIYATQNKKQVEWHFNDDIFGAYDWTVEPTESLTELYHRRARELREQYDYVSISYSGGSDSHNVLMSFIDQGLHVDEILVNTFEKANTMAVNDPNITASWNFGAEYKLQILPRLEEIRHRIPNTKITVRDMSDTVIDYFKNSEEGWSLEQNEVLNPSGITRYNYLNFVDTRVNFDKDKKFCIVVGVEKPLTVILDNKFYVIFIDRHTNITSVKQHFTGQENTNIEFFYWGPSCADMVAKQAHVIKKYITLDPKLIELWTFKDSRSFTINNNKIINPLLRTVIYEGIWNTSWFQVEKGIQFYHDEIDTWWRSLYKGTIEYSKWEAGIKLVQEQASSFVDAKGEMLLFRKSYYVGEMPHAGNGFRV